MKILRLGFIGAGKWMSWYHLPTVQYLQKSEKVEPVVIWNRTRRKAEGLAQEFAIGHVASSVEDLLTNYKIDGVIIAVSRESAASMIRLASATGVPFLVEKPPADTLAEADELSEIVRIPHLVAFNRVYAPLMAELSNILAKVRPYHMTCVFARRNRDDMRFVFETGIHALTNGEYLFGPGELQSLTRDILPDRTTYWRATIYHRDTTAFTTTVDYLFAPWSGRAVERYQIFASDTSIEVFCRQHYAPDDEERIITSTADADGVKTSVWHPEDVPEVERAGYAGEHRAFYETIRYPEKTVFPTLRRTASLMAVADQINEGY